ncbi:MAG: ergothioneine biosynthesis protein EgtC [Gammaproteobacteria bacterium]|jgi:glutamine amidotransferase|nr:ergothioneine biosynthesis protein EgtC [Gammaproteobacteria bacterium]
MCRLAAYLGPDITLQQFLFEPDHSLYKQSWEPRELKYTKFNADGYGFGWFSQDGIPSAYTSILPIWSDRNLPSLARTLTNSLWLAEVRSATAGNPVHQYNTAPFCDDQLVFVHNGFIRNFHLQVLPRISPILAPVIAADIHGNTDSEYLFACMRQMLLDDEDLDLTGALQKLFEWLEKRITDEEALLNIIVSDGNRLYASRHGFNHECASLYYTTDDELFPGAQLIASERFSEDSFWQPVPEHHLLILDRDNPPELLAL